MGTRDREAWKQDDTVEMWVNVEANDGDVRETARRVVNDSAPMAAIRRSVEERGLDPIWTQLITEFGTMMYLQGWRSHWPADTEVHERKLR